MVMLVLAMGIPLMLKGERQPTARRRSPKPRMEIPPPVYDSASARKVEDVINKGGPEAIDVFIEMLKRPDPPSKRTAAEALAKMRSQNPDAVPLLIPMLKDHWMDWEAASALSAIGPGAKAAVPDLISLLKRRTGLPGYYAARALGNIGPDAKVALPALREAMKSRNSLVQLAACLAVYKLDPQCKEEVVPILADIYRARPPFPWGFEAIREMAPELLKTKNR
jgi:HEAT repeat protein